MALLALAVAGRFAQEDYLELRYSSAAPDYPRTEQPSVELGQGLGAAYDWARDTRDENIGALGHDGGAVPVRALGPGRHRTTSATSASAATAGRSKRSPSVPSGSRRINNGDYDYVITTPAYDQDDSRGGRGPGPGILGRGGADNVRTVAGAGLVDVWQLTGPLDPIACGKVKQPVVPVAELAGRRLLPSAEWAIRSTTRSTNGRRATAGCGSSPRRIPAERVG